MTERQHIIIKGVKEGLIFLLDDQCDWETLMAELQFKLEKSHQQLLAGPLVHVHVRLGSRMANDQQLEQIRDLFKRQGNLVIQSMETSQSKVAQEDGLPLVKARSAIIRSGQVIEHEGDLLLLGDVNPGGTIICTGDIYVMGALRGVAHAGYGGRKDAIIAASLLRPSQLRIADVISRPPEEWLTVDAVMEVAFLQEGQMQIDKLTNLHRMRQIPINPKGV